MRTSPAITEKTANIFLDGKDSIIFIGIHSGDAVLELCIRGKAPLSLSVYTAPISRIG